MEVLADLISKLGFPIAISVAIVVVFIKIINRIMDENKERELRSAEQQERTNTTLTNIASTIERSNDTNEQLAETNRLLVDKVEGDLTGIKSSLDIINNKLDK